ncbi:SIMPL domain-containing protein [Flavobacterium beibuense]|uniref:SIMPL superfamily protein n=1 Tax=Flavobacterium beibuense TaxID=657326 RepID=A0A444WFC4_9FLAO|nr:SIMPL domain-containing protein [Flavobacterium beibuense]RYJ44527.1 SIMPL superfamily protein [Flavobacterium beibuense]
MKNMFLVMLMACSSLFAQKNFIDQPFITTSATADTLIMPDIIKLKITLREGDSRGKKAVEDMEKDMETTLKALGIDTKKDLTLGTLDSEYQRYFLSGQKINKTKMYTLEVHDAVMAGKVIAALEQQDISNVHIEKKDYSKKEELIMELKLKAIKRACKNASLMATSAGSKLGKALFITDKSFKSESLYKAALLEEVVITKGRSSSYEPIPTEFEKLLFSVEVNTVFALE